MRWFLLVALSAACNRHAGIGDAGSAAAGADPRIDFVCPSQPLNEGTACTMPPNERCKYFIGGEWQCLVCDKSRHWVHVHC